MIPILISGGADANRPDVNGMTPLHLAIDIEADGASQSGARPSAEITRTLLAQGARTDVRDSLGRTPIDLAREYQHEDAIAVLKKYSNI